MGTHGAAGTRVRALTPRRNTVSSNSVNSARRRLLNPFDWPVARRLFAVIVAALLMGLVFGGLRVYDSEGAASQFSRVSQLANLGEQLTVLVNDLQNERDATLLVLTSDNDASVVPLWAQTHRAVPRSSGRPASAACPPTSRPTSRRRWPTSVPLASAPGIGPEPELPPQDEGAVIGNYDADINDMIVLADQVSQGVSNASLTSDVEALNALSLAKEQASEERGLINYSIAGTANPGSLTTFFNPNLGTSRRDVAGLPRRPDHGAVVHDRVQPGVRRRVGLLRVRHPGRERVPLQRVGLRREVRRRQPGGEPLAEHHGQQRHLYG